MLTRRARAAAAAAALCALVLLVGTAAYLATTEEPAPPTTTTTTTVPVAAVAQAIADSLAGSLDVAITREEATCVAHAVIAVVPPAELEHLESLDAPLAALDSFQRNQLVQGVVRCVPPTTAAALLASSTTTAPPPVQLPDEGT